MVGGFDMAADVLWLGAVSRGEISSLTAMYLWAWLKPSKVVCVDTKQLVLYHAPSPWSTHKYPCPGRTIFHIITQC